MSYEMSKATKRRSSTREIAMYHHRYFNGDGIDVGCGPDIMDVSGWTNVLSLVGYDRELGHKDAQYLEEIADNQFDFLVSSHCLEHMQSPVMALSNWLRAVKPGGHLVITIPDWVMYEHRMWPSKFNGDHKWAFTTDESEPIGRYNLLYIPDLLKSPMLPAHEIVSIETITDNFQAWLAKIHPLVDQTAGPAECAIEIVLRKL